MPSQFQVEFLCLTRSTGQCGIIFEAQQSVFTSSLVAMYLKHICCVRGELRMDILPCIANVLPEQYAGHRVEHLALTYFQLLCQRRLFIRKQNTMGPLLITTGEVGGGGGGGGGGGIFKKNCLRDSVTNYSRPCSSYSEDRTME